MVIAFEYLKSLPYLPVALMRGKKQGMYYGRPSNAEIKRWLYSYSVIINGLTPLPDDEIIFPITELIFFPKGKRKTTLIKKE